MTKLSQQDAERQGAEQQDAERQGAEQQDAEQQDAERQGAERQDAERREQVVHWFQTLRDRLCKALENLEENSQDPQDPQDSESSESSERSKSFVPRAEATTIAAARFRKERWQREDTRGGDGGGGEMALMRGRTFEKAGVNVSTVYGTFDPTLQREIKGAAQDGKFWASGVSLVAHPRSPRVPAAHFNTRYIHSAHGWFGGGADLTPNEDDPAMRELFHNAFRRVCDKYEQGRYEAYAKACDAYFTIRHRNRVRGAGGIFFDDLREDWQRDFDFVRETGEAFLEVFPKIVRARINLPWSAEQRAQQLRVRGYYAEFNLIYDRGTRFGLLTKGNPDAVLMSLPPLAAW